MIYKVEFIRIDNIPILNKITPLYHKNQFSNFLKYNGYKFTRPTILYINTNYNTNDFHYNYLIKTLKPYLRESKLKYILNDL